MRDKIYFLSDAHLGADPPEQERLKGAKLQSFLDLVKQEGKRLYLVGDLFEFYFEYRTVLPREHLQTLSLLRDVHAAGLPITYVVGNHDYWFNSLDHSLRIEVVPDYLDIVLQGKRLFIAHGDGLGKGDYGYRVLKKILRHPVNIFLYSLIHPDLGIPLAKGVARLSRAKGYARTGVRLRSFARAKLAQGYDVVILGHSHVPGLSEEEGGIYLNLGDWREQFTYGVLEDGRLRLEHWK